MALNKDVLGGLLATAAAEFNDKPISAEELTTARANFWKAVAEQIIDHIKTAGVVNVTVSTTGTASAQAGSGTGTIS